jgi:hypothetical protein
VGRTALVWLDELDGESRQLLGSYEDLVTVASVEDLVFPQGESVFAQASHLAFDVIRLEGDMFEAFPLFLEKAVEPRAGIPVLDQVKGTLITQLDLGDRLVSLSLIVSDELRSQAEDPLETVSGIRKVPDYDTEVVSTQDCHDLRLPTSR